MLKDFKNLSEPQAILLLIVLAAVIILAPAAIFFPYEYGQEQSEKIIASIFKTPADKVIAFNSHNEHSGINFEVISQSAPLVLDRSFKEINLDLGPLGDKRESWMTRCHYRPHTEFLSKPDEVHVSGELGVYEDNVCSRAFVVGESSHSYIRSSLSSREMYNMPEGFTKIFKTPFDQKGGNRLGPEYKIGQYYRTNNINCFEVFSPVKPLVLKHHFQSIDPQICKVEFPPGQKKEPWMTHCYYYCWPAEFLQPKVECWVFANNSFERAYVIFKFPSGQGYDCCRYYRVASVLYFPYSKRPGH